MQKSEAREVLGEIAIFWQNPSATPAAKQRFWEHDFREQEREAIRTLFGSPEWDEQLEPAESHIVMVNLMTAIAIATERFGVSKTKLLAAIGLGEIEGIAPGCKEFERDALLEWLDEKARQADGSVNDDAQEKQVRTPRHVQSQIGW